MKLVPPSPVVKAWRRALRKRVRANPRLKREHRRATVPPWRRNHAWTALRWVIAPIIFVVVATGYQPELALNQMLLWSLLILFVRAQQVANLGFSADAHWLHFLWPVTDDDVYRHSRRLVLKSSLWLGVDWLAFAAGLAWQTGNPWLLAAAVPLGFAQSAIHLLVATQLTMLRPTFRFGALIVPLWLLTFFSVKLQAAHGLIAELTRLLWIVLHTATPAGWIARLWNQPETGGGLLSACALVVVCGLLCWLLRQADRRLRAGFSLNALFGYETEEAVAERLHGELSAEPIDEEFAGPAEATVNPLIPADIDRLRDVTREILAEPAGKSFFRRSPVEATIGHLFTARERVLVDFFAPMGMTWLRRWLISAGLVMLTFATAMISPPFAMAPAVAAVLFALPVFGGGWRGFESTRIFGSNIAVNAFLPIGFGETCLLTLKTNLALCIGGFPLVLLAVHLGLAPQGATLAWTLDYSLRGIALVIALQPVWLLGRFSGNTNDSSSGGALLAITVLVGLLALIAGVTLCVTAAMAERFVVAISCLAALGALLHAALAIYGWLWGKAHFDLMAKQQ